MNCINDILEMSGPFTSDKAKLAHAHWLEGLSPDKQQARLAALRENEQQRMATLAKRSNFKSWLRKPR